MDMLLNSYDFCCPNKLCGDYGKRGRDNIVVQNRYGRDHRKLLRCRTCNSKFSERRSTFFFRMHTEESKIKEVIEYLIKGMSYREAATNAEIDKDTVQRIWKRFLEYCEESMNSLLEEFNIELEDLIWLLHDKAHKRNKIIHLT
jgi:LacI family transcriptional regulator